MLPVAVIVCFAIFAALALIGGRRALFARREKSGTERVEMSGQAFLSRAERLLGGQDASFALVSAEFPELLRRCAAFGPDELRGARRFVLEVLSEQLGGQEIAACTGEATFCFLLKDRGADEICARLAHIAEALEEPRRRGERAYPLRMRCGVCLRGTGGQTAAAMLDQAVLARVDCPDGQLCVFCAPDARGELRGGADMARELTEALRCGGLSVSYQPRVRVLDQRVAGAEALVRWEHPRRGLLSSDMFLPDAEKYGMSGQIDRFVLREVCRTLARWRAQERELCPISVSLSRESLENGEFASDALALCRESGVEPALIEFEAREKLLLALGQRSVSLFEQLHAAGFRCAVDAFGAVDASLALLSTLPIDTVKLDRSFFSGKNDNRGGRYIVEAVLKLASQLQLRTVAEGVDTQGQVRYLQRAACDMLQGFYYFKPLSAQRFESEAYEGKTLGHASRDAEASAGEMSAVGRSVADAKSIVLFSYRTREDSIAFSDAFSLVLEGETEFADASALLRTTELVYENDREDLFRLLERCQRERGWAENTLRFYLSEGRYGWLEVHAHADGDGNISGTMINLAHWKKEADRWREKASRDALTGLYNREHFERTVQSRLAQGDCAGAALLFIDVDDFKRVNDTLGHQFGDDVLCYVAKQLLGVFRHTDVIARYGGDEFVVFAPSIGRAVLEDRLERLCRAFAFPCRSRTHEYKISGSIGAAIYPEDGDSYETLLAHADCALYEAKGRGKDCFVLYERHMQGKQA